MILKFCLSSKHIFPPYIWGFGTPLTSSQIRKVLYSLFGVSGMRKYGCSLPIYNIAPYPCAITDNSQQLLLRVYMRMKHVSNDSSLLIITPTLYLIFNIHICCIVLSPHQMVFSQVFALARDECIIYQGEKLCWASSRAEHLSVS